MRRTAFVLALTLVPAALTPAAASIFRPAGEELVYTGTGPGLEEGVLVIRDDAAFDQAIAPLDPAFGAPRPDLSKRVVLRIVGRARENGCRETALLEASTKFTKTTLKLEERIPDKACACAQGARPPKVWLVVVDRAVRTADVVKTDRVIPCPEAATVQQSSGAKPVQVFEGSWDADPGAKVIVDQNEYRQLLLKMGIGDRGPQVDFEKERIVAVTGRPRENSCRKTSVIDTKLASPEEAVFEIEEHYASTGQMCAQVFMHPRLFLYRVPATVMRAKVTTKEVR